jgi:hypothetical protein
LGQNHSTLVFKTIGKRNTSRDVSHHWSETSQKWSVAWRFWPSGAVQPSLWSHLSRNVTFPYGFFGPFAMEKTLSRFHTCT